MAECYDPVHDLSVVLAGALRQGFHGPAAKAALERLRLRLGLHAEHPFTSDVEEAVRTAVSCSRRRAEALENVRFLASLPPDLLREAVLVWQYEHPEKAARLLALLTQEEASRG